MSVWKFGAFEAEVDFTDADFLDALDEAKNLMNEKLTQVPETGKASDLIRAQVACFYAFFDGLFGAGAAQSIFEGRKSLELCLQAAESITDFEQAESSRMDSAYKKYYVQNHGNREQRRQYQKNVRKRQG